ncbi:MAG TPA: hypothetical protein VIG74_05210 [Alphaproteobacteria bacterium]|jgi:hypothetical protein
MKRIHKHFLTAQAAIIVGMMSGANDAHATNFGDIAANIVDSIEELPGLLSGIAYLFGLLLGVLGVLKVKDHVENPSQTPLKDGAIRMAAGGAMFALPMIYESMSNTIGSTTETVGAAKLSPVTFGLR